MEMRRMALGDPLCVGSGNEGGSVVFSRIRISAKREECKEGDGGDEGEWGDEIRRGFIVRAECGVNRVSMAASCLSCNPVWCVLRNWLLKSVRMEMMEMKR